MRSQLSCDRRYECFPWVHTCCQFLLDDIGWRGHYKKGVCSTLYPGIVTRLVEMVAFAARFLSIVCLSLVFATSTGANPTPLYPRHATHRTRHIGRDLKLEVYHPPTTYEVCRVAKPLLSCSNSPGRHSVKALHKAPQRICAVAPSPTGLVPLCNPSSTSTLKTFHTRAVTPPRLANLPISSNIM